MNSTIGTFIQSLKPLIASKQHNNAFFKSIDYSIEHIEDAGIKFQVKLLSLLKDKPEASKETFNKEQKDPFMPPFEDGAFITEILDTHNLIFNKYNIAQGHVVVTT